MRKNSRRFVAIDPQTGQHLRRAKPHEVREFRKANMGRKRPFSHHSFDQPVRVGDVLITTYTGPGQWHIPGRFLP